jgi:hypothetical protein
MPATTATASSSRHRQMLPVMPVTVATMTSPVRSTSLVTDRVRQPFRLLDTQTVVRMLVSKEWAREHAAELGPIRVGDGPNGCASRGRRTMSASTQEQSRPTEPERVLCRRHDIV